MKKFCQKFWPLFFIFLVWFIFASPYFLKNEVPYPSNYQANSVPPWSYYERFWGPIKNNAMPDIVGQLYPWRYFSINMLKIGEIPFWNPYSFSGNPHLANYQSAVFSPLNFLFFIFPFVDAWSIAVLLQPLLAGLFIYFLMKEFKVSNVGSVISSIVFMFCGFIVVWMAYGTLSLAVSFLPLALFAIEKFYNTKKLRFLSILSITIPLSFFSGHFQTSLYFMIFISAYIFYKSIFSKSILNSFILILYTFFGLLISLIQIAPSIEFYLNSVRSEIFIGKGTGIPFHYLITIFSPDFFGNPVTRNDWFGYYAEWSSFIGIIPLALSLFALTSKQRALPFFFFLAGILFLLFAINSPISDLIGYLKVPVLSTSNPTRIIVLFSFSFAILAGFGLDNLMGFFLKKEFKRLIFPFALIGLLLIFIWMLLFLETHMPADKTMIAKRNLILPSILFMGTIFAVFFSIFNKKLMLLSIFYLLFSASFDSFRFAQKWMPFDPKDFVFADTPIIDVIKKNIGNGRYFGNLGDQVGYYSFSSIEGYDPLYIDRYGEFIRSSGNGEYLQSERSVVKIARDGKYTDRVLDLLGVSLIFHPKADTNQGWAYPVWKDTKRYSLIYQDNKFQLFKNNMALPRVLLFYDYEVIEDKKDILKRFYSDDFDFRNTILLESHPEEEIKAKKKKNELKGRVDIRQYKPNEILIDVTTDSPAFLFLSDNYYPGWKVTIDEKETKIYRANYTFMAVVVDEGEHEVKFIYDPLSFRVGIYGAFAGILGILGFAFFRRFPKL